MKFRTQQSLLLLAGFALFVAASEGATLLDPRPEASTTRFGASVVVIGDVNGDGVPDFAVGAPFQDGDFLSNEKSFGKPQNVGKVYVIDGANLAMLGRLDDPEFQRVQPQHFGGQLGSSIAVVADLDGDGIPDVIAGVPHHIADPDSEDSIKNAGEALVFSSATGAVLFTLSDPTAEEQGRMGDAVAGLSDVDGDGTADLLVGAPGKDIGGEDGIANVGLAYIFSGKTGQLIRTINHPDEGGAEAGAAFGAAVANAGDLDKDRVSDLLIGAPGEGKAFVFSGKTGALLLTLVNPFPETLPSFGAAVAGGKDFNGDRKPDLVIGSPAREDQRGAVYIFNGSDGSLQRTLFPAVRQPFARFGATVLVADGVAGNRRPGIVVGAPGQNVNGLVQAGAVITFDGRRGRIFQNLTSMKPQTRALFGTAVGAADFDGDGVATIVTGTPNQDAVIDSDDGPVPHLEIGQIEVQP